ncbi:hypothetical protein IDVR_28240 [Intrasporangium sp. DVR]
MEGEQDHAGEERHTHEEAEQQHPPGVADRQHVSVAAYVHDTSEAPPPPPRSRISTSKILVGSC